MTMDEQGWGSAEGASEFSKEPGRPGKPNVHYNLVSHLGFKVDRANSTADLAVGDFEVTPELLQPLGYLHGGAMAAFADTLCAVGTVQNIDPSREYFLTVEFKMNMIRAVRVGRVRGEARPVNRGRTVQLWECKLFDDKDRLIAMMTATQMVLKLSGDAV